MGASDDDASRKLLYESEATLARVTASLAVTRDLALRSQRRIHESRAVLAHLDAGKSRGVLHAIALGDFFARTAVPATVLAGAVGVHADIKPRTKIRVSYDVRIAGTAWLVY